MTLLDLKKNLNELSIQNCVHDVWVLTHFALSLRTCVFALFLGRVTVTSVNLIFWVKIPYGLNTLKLIDNLIFLVG